jgi:outer membrane lipoprotein-sorting protein
MLMGFANTTEDAKSIVNKSFTVNKMTGSEAISKLIIRDAKGRERIRKTSMATKMYDNGKTEKKIIRFLEPADVKGTSMLTFDYQSKDDDMWIYLPALRKTRKIVSSEKGKSFMGSEFTNADMVMPNVEDFNFKMISANAKIGEVVCWKIEMMAKDDDIMDEYGYSKRVVWIGKKDYVVRKAEVYDIDDELLKNMTVKKIKMVDTKNKKYAPTHMVIKNVQNDRSSEMIIEKIIYNPNVKDEYFSIAYLER